MPLVLAIGAVAVAGTVALTRPHPAPALRATSGGLAESAPLVRSAYAERHLRSRDGSAVVDGASPSAATRVVVYVAGEVRRPGVYSVDARSRVEGALRAALGPTEKADLLAVNLAEPLSDGEKVLIPPKGEAPANDGSTPATSAYSATQPDSYSSATAYGSPRRHHRRSSSSSSGRHRRSHRSHKTPPSEPIDINAAEAPQLEQLPGIGPSLAERIVTFREVNGPFHSTDELLDVSGMTDKRLDAISNYVMVRSP